MITVSSMRLVKLATAAIVSTAPSLARAGMVDVAASPGAGEPAPTYRLAIDLTQPIPAGIVNGDSKNARHLDPQIISNHFDQPAVNDESNSHILDLAPRVSFLVTASDASANGAPAEAGSGLADQPDKDEPRGLALPDSLRMFPLGALVAAFAIRRMQRSARRA